MSESEQNVEVRVGKTVCEVTGMRGRTIGYLRKYFNDNGFPTSTEHAEVFTGAPTEADPAAIVQRREGLQMGTNPRGLSIVQGLIVTVTEDYVISSGDICVKFTAYTD